MEFQDNLFDNRKKTRAVYIEYYGSNDEECIQIVNEMNEKSKSPKTADPNKLWLSLKLKYRDGDEFVDGNMLIWDVWKKDGGFVLYCGETKESVEVPKPKELGG